MERRIGIVGAGISGILACKYAVAKGYHPIVIESRNSIGGVWTKTLETTRLQSPRQFYQFSDFPWPIEVETFFPDQKQVLHYLHSYVNHFDLIKHIRFNTKVVSINYDGPSDDEIKSWALWGGNGEPFGNKGTWTITMKDLLTHSIQATQVDFVVLCLGKYSDLPNIPEFPDGKGPEAFHGKVMHSMEYANMENQSAKDLIKGKKVTVVGFQKSALDIAMQCYTTNGVENPCTIICRTPRWNLLDHLAWGIPITYLYFNRFAELLLHKPGQGPLLDAVASFLSPVRWGISKLVESDVKKKQRLEKFGLVPDHSFLEAVNTCSACSIPDGFYDNADKGSLIFKRSPTFYFCKEGVQLDESVKDNEKVVESDLVILATGFKGYEKLKDVFASPFFQEAIMGSPKNTIPLYRQCIHPRIPQLAAIGFSESVTNVCTYEMGCRWLMELLDGKFKLPSIQIMEKDISNWDKFMKRYCGKSYRKSCMGGVNIWYTDQLCKDMGLNPKRKKGLWAELFEPYETMDYATTT